MLKEEKSNGILYIVEFKGCPFTIIEVQDKSHIKTGSLSAAAPSFIASTPALPSSILYWISGYLRKNPSAKWL